MRFKVFKTAGGFKMYIMKFERIVPKRPKSDSIDREAHDLKIICGAPSLNPIDGIILSLKLGGAVSSYSVLFLYSSRQNTDSRRNF